jgi:MFS family permease
MACLTAASSATYSMGVASMTRDLNCTTFQANIGVAMYPLGFSLVPLVSASFSEEFGRQPLYLGSIILFALSHVMVALYAWIIPFLLHTMTHSSTSVHQTSRLSSSADSLLVPSVRPGQPWWEEPLPIYFHQPSESSEYLSNHLDNRPASYSSITTDY